MLTGGALVPSGSLLLRTESHMRLGLRRALSCKPFLALAWLEQVDCRRTGYPQMWIDGGI